MKVTASAVRRPIGTSILYLAVAVFGVVSVQQLAVDLLPSVDMPRISVTTPYEGVAPEEIETLITRPLEQAVSRIQGMDRLEAVSAEGLSRLSLQFAWGTDLSEALDDVRVAIDRIRPNLPEDAESPTVFKFDLSSFSIATLGVTGNGDPRTLKRLAEDTLSRRLERVTGVAAVDTRGGRDREIRIELSADRLSALGIGATQVADAVRRENRTVSAGDMRDVGRTVVIRTAGEYEKVEDIGQVVVAERDGHPIRVADLGRVVDGYRELRSELWVDGEPGIRLRVYKQSGANTVEVAQGLRREIEAINRDYAGHVVLTMLIDSSTFIESAIAAVRSSALIGALLAILVLMLFLRDVRATAVIATSIPLSILATFGLMQFTGITLNVVSFGGLALGIGMLVDGAIVILENIHRKSRAGKAPVDAAIEGSSEVGTAVIAGTLTTLAVFVPVVYLGDFAGVFFRELATVVSCALACSLVVALTLVPMLAARLLRAKHGDKEQAHGFLERLEHGYGVTLRGALTSPLLVVLLGVALLGASVLLLPWVGVELTPQADEGRLNINVELPVGTPIENTMGVMQDVEARVRGQLREGELEHIVTNAGPESWWRPSGSNEGGVELYLVSASQRTRSSDEIEKAVRDALADVPGAQIRIRQTTSNWLMRFMRGGGDDRLRIEIRGDELAQADALAARVMQRIEGIDGVTHMRPDRELGQLERVIRVDRTRAAELGLGSAEVATAVEHYVLGRVATHFREHGDEYDVRVVMNKADRAHLEQLGELPIVTPDGRRVPLSALTQVEEHRGPSSIARRDQQRVLTIDVGTGERALGDVAADVRKALAGLEIPEGFSIQLGGELEEQEETFGGLLLGILLAVFLVYTVMAVQFESLRQPLVVMVSVPFAFIGVVLTLLLSGTTFNMYSFLGAIVLVGIVVNNAIVLIDYANALRAEGMSADDALVAAGQRRLQPILMTTLTTVLAMLPLALSAGEGNELQAPLARVVIGGLLTSTLVTLLLVPCVYVLMERPLARRGRGTGGKPTEQAETNARHAA